MKDFDWSNEKNEKLKMERDICFEEIVSAIMDGKVVYEKPHNNQKKYPNQKIFILNIDNYAYVVPFVENDEKIFLKTIMPSRKATKKYILKINDK